MIRSFPHRRFLILVAALALVAVGETSRASPEGRGAYARLDASFELPGLSGNPYDYTENDVQVAFARPDGKRGMMPAFFDGNTTWRVRYTPDLPGRYTIAEVAFNGHAVEPKNLSRREFTVSGKPTPGFVRISADGKRFVFSDGEPYYPMGCDIGWSARSLSVPDYMTRLGQAGINWSRVWMCHFDDRNLNWSRTKALPLGDLRLDVVRKWDAIVEAAEKQGIYFQFTLQHHGQFSVDTDSSWRRNPWNKANGGWLESAADFFTDARAGIDPGQVPLHRRPLGLFAGGDGLGVVQRGAVHRRR